jgi:hypothetical protein
MCTIYRNILVPQFVIRVYAFYNTFAWSEEISTTRYRKNNVKISRIRKYNPILDYIL